MKIKHLLKTSVAVAVLVIGSQALSAEEPAAKPTGETVTINLAVDKGPVTYRASGFLHAMSATDPKPEMVDPLKPKTFRMAAEDWHKIGAGAFANYERVQKLGATLQVVVSDNHGYGLSPWWPGDNDDWTAWEMLIESIMKRAQKGGYKFEWDIWNEPDGKYFWPHSRERFFETWKRGYEKIRSLDPKAVIVGPSIAGYSKKYMGDFLLYAKQNNVLPDVLAWHEFGDPKHIVVHAAEMRNFMSQNGIKINRISINEILNGGQTLYPGITVHYFANLERAGVDSACHACWNDKDKGISACENQSLDGILTYPDKQPRSPWWAYKGYADITGRLVDLAPSATVDGVAGLDSSAKDVTAVLGRNGGEAGDVAVEIMGLNKADYLVRGGKVRVRYQRIPASGWEALLAPDQAVVSSLSAEDGKVKIIIPNFGPNDAYTISIH